MNNLAQLKSKEPLQKSSLFRWLAGALIVLFIIAPVSIYAWRYLYNPCEVAAVKEASSFLTNQVKFYDQVYQVAVSASRTSFDRPVITMQQIQMDTQEVAMPACMQTAKNEAINYMATVIRAFRAWGAGEPDATIFGLIKQSDAHYANFKAELKTINKCAPFCIR
jgi:hypothetical protein